MYRRFFYFPNPAYTGCDDDLPPVKFDDCNPDIRLSEIRRIFVAKLIAAPFEDWTDQAEWLNRLSDVSTAGNDYIRTLVVRGNKPAPSAVTKDLTNFRRLTITKNHVLNFLIDEVTEENHNLVRQTEAGPQQVLAWYETHGGKMLGGNSGIRTFIKMDLVLNEGPEEIQTINGVLDWKNRFTEEMIESPIFYIGNTGTVTTFDTILEFDAAVSDAAAGVTGTVAALDDDKQFQFDAITPQVGTPESMTINLGGVEVMLVDYTTDYTGQPFRFIDSAGVSHIGAFQSGNVNF